MTRRLALVLFVLSGAATTTAHDRPFRFSVSTPADSSASSFRLEYDVGAGEQPFAAAADRVVWRGWRKVPLGLVAVPVPVHEE
jgi:hypothetical protein